MDLFFVVCTEWASARVENLKGSPIYRAPARAQTHRLICHDLLVLGLFSCDEELDRFCQVSSVNPHLVLLERHGEERWFRFDGTYELHCHPILSRH